MSKDSLEKQQHFEQRNAKMKQIHFIQGNVNSSVLFASKDEILGQPQI